MWSYVVHFKFTYICRLSFFAWRFLEDFNGLYSISGVKMYNAVHIITHACCFMSREITQCISLTLTIRLYTPPPIFILFCSEYFCIYQNIERSILVFSFPINPSRHWAPFWITFICSSCVCGTNSLFLHCAVSSLLCVWFLLLCLMLNIMSLFLPLLILIV